MSQLTKEQVEASLLPVVTNTNLLQLLEAAKKTKVTPETISVNFSDMIILRSIYIKLKERKDEEDAPDKARIKARKEGYETYMKPVEELLEIIDPQFAIVNAEIKRREKVIKDDIEKQNKIRSRHLEFVNDTAKMIAVAPDNTELARIQKLIGSEKARTGFYGTYHDKIKEVCDLLLKLVDDRKKIIKDNTKLQKDYDKWLLAGDITRATQLKEEMEQNERVINENVLAIAQSAYEQVSAVSLLDTELVSAAITPRLHRWSWKVEDIDLLYQKMPEMVLKEPNTKSINAFMKSKVDANELSDDDDNNFYGLILYRKPFFVSIKTNKDAS